MEKVVENNANNQSEASNQTILKRAAIAPAKSDLNIGAKPFHPLLQVDSKQNKGLELKIPLDSDIWKCISSNSQRNCQELKSISKPQKFVGAPIKIESIPRSTLHRLLSMNISSEGLIHIFRSDNIHIQISMDQAVHVTCRSQNIHLSISSSATSAAIWHPIGRILQRDSHIDVVTMGVTNKTLRMAKFWFKGISFTTENIPIVYLMDEAGLRTSNDRFMDIKKCQISQTFTEGMSRGSFWFDEAADAMHKSVHSKRIDGTEIIEINRMRVISEPNGVLHIQRPNKKCTIRINPRKAGISLTTAHMHCSASLGNSAHIFLRQGERRIHFDGNIFCVRNVGHSAGLDDQNKVSIFNKYSTI